MAEPLKVNEIRGDIWLELVYIEFIFCERK